MMSRSNTITVFFNDSFDSSADEQSIVGALAKSAKAQSDVDVYIYHGVDKTHGFIAGGLFSAGLDTHTKVLVKVVSDRIAQRSLANSAKPLKLNIVGVGRGGISACLLVKALKDFSPRDLNIQLIMYDPVPTNSRSAVKLDFFHWTWANISLDLQQCKHLKKVFAFYTNNLLVNFFLHTPIIPVYPRDCQVNTEILPGLNRYFTKPLAANENNGTWYMNDLAFIIFDRMRMFLYNNGTIFDSSLKDNISVDNIIRVYNPQGDNNAWLKRSYEAVLMTEKSASLWYKLLCGARPTFSMAGSHIRTNIVADTTLLNEQHAKLKGQTANDKVGMTIDKNILPDSRCAYSLCFFQPSTKTYLETLGFVVGGIIGGMLVLSPLFFSAPSILAVATYMQAHLLETTLLTIMGAVIGAVTGEVLGDQIETLMWPSLKPM